MPGITRDKLDPEAQRIWDNILANRSGAAMRGPSAALIAVPPLAERVMNTEDYFRTDADLPAQDRELVILTVAREFEAHFPWARHEARGKEAGMRPEAIEILRSRGSLDELTSREKLLVDVVHGLLRNHRLSDELFERVNKELGQRQFVELLALMGNYCLIGIVADAYEIPEDSKTF